jgi:hypothetical protein
VYNLPYAFIQVGGYQFCPKAMKESERERERERKERERRRERKESERAAGNSQIPRVTPTKQLGQGVHLDQF